MNEGLVGAEGFAVDASIIEADASRYHGVAGDEAIDWSNPMLRSLAGTPAFERSRNERKKVEMLFAHLKRDMRHPLLTKRGHRQPAIQRVHQRCRSGSLIRGSKISPVL